jgi:putative SOS response-associated peptidase YedK
MSVIFEINRDFPYQVSLAFDEAAIEVLEWLDGATFEWDMYVDLPENLVRYCFRTLAVCGRVRPSSDYSEIKVKLKFAPNAAAPNFEPSWNKAPTEPMLVAIRSVDGARVPKMTKWGLIPYWAKDDKLHYTTFNARSEDFRTKPSFRDGWSNRRGLLALLKPCPDDVLEIWPVGKAVGNVRNNGPELVMRADEQARLL